MEVDYAREYRILHKSSKKKFAGYSIAPHTRAIADLVLSTKAASLLDYGCGKGLQYSVLHVQDAWGGIVPWCFDVGVKEFAARPSKTFDGVICTDVMEHINVKDVSFILRDVLCFADKFVFFAICGRPSKKTFSDGRNLHLTVRSQPWWQDKIDRAVHALKLNEKIDKTHLQISLVVT